MINHVWFTNSQASFKQYCIKLILHFDFDIDFPLDSHKHWPCWLSYYTRLAVPRGPLADASYSASEWVFFSPLRFTNKTVSLMFDKHDKDLRVGVGIAKRISQIYYCSYSLVQNILCTSLTTSGLGKNKTGQWRVDFSMHTASAPWGFCDLVCGVKLSSCQNIVLYYLCYCVAFLQIQSTTNCL